MREHNIHVDIDKCICCGLCVKTCAAHNIEVKNGKANILLEQCMKCGQCSAVCPKEAITISGYDTRPLTKKDDIRLHPDDVLDVIRYRRTIRQFQNKEISTQIVNQLLEAGRLTHTAKNMQDISFVVLTKEKNQIEQMAVRLFRKLKPFVNVFDRVARNNQIDDHFFFFHAPVVIVILAKNKTNGILAAQNMEFVAEANGLGVLFSGFFTTAANMSRKIKKVMKIPKGKKIAATLVLGYPSVKFYRSVQREAAEVTYL